MGTWNRQRTIRVDFGQYRTSLFSMTKKLWLGSSPEINGKRSWSLSQFLNEKGKTRILDGQLDSIVQLSVVKLTLLIEHQPSQWTLGHNAMRTPSATCPVCAGILLSSTIFLILFVRISRYVSNNDIFKLERETSTTWFTCREISSFYSIG